MKIRHESKALNKLAKELRQKFYLTKDSALITEIKDCLMRKDWARWAIRIDWGAKESAMPQRKRKRLCSYRNTMVNFIMRNAK